MSLQVTGFYSFSVFVFKIYLFWKSVMERQRWRDLPFPGSFPQMTIKARQQRLHSSLPVQAGRVQALGWFSTVFFQAFSWGLDRKWAWFGTYVGFCSFSLPIVFHRAYVAPFLCWFICICWYIDDTSWLLWIVLQQAYRCAFSCYNYLARRMKGWEGIG